MLRLNKKSLGFFVGLLYYPCMTYQITDTKQGQPLTVSENKTAQNVQKKENKMKKLDAINLKNNEKIQIQIAKDSYVEIVKLDSGSVMVEVNHYNTSAVKKVKLNDFTGFKNVDETSWSQCDTSFSEEETRVNVQHTAFNK
tara:strand:- start:562 stop:984 length:423 start_codon:yes stop_codon:yes gene_type:complete